MMGLKLLEESYGPGKVLASPKSPTLTFRFASNSIFAGYIMIDIVDLSSNTDFVTLLHYFSVTMSLPSDHDE